MTMNLGQQLKVIRALYGIKQSAMADEVGISAVYLSQFENGRFNLTDEEIGRIRTYLKNVGVESPIIIHLSDKLALAA